MTGIDVYKKLMEYGVPENHARILAAVAYPESGYDPVSELVTPKEDSVGLFQINMKAHWDKLQKWTKSDDPSVWRTWLQNPENNIYAAAQVYHSQGLGAWTVYQKGTYVPYMNKLENLVVKSGGTKASSIPGSDSEQVSQSSQLSLSPLAVAGGAVLLALVLAAGVALMITGGMRSA